MARKDQLSNRILQSELSQLQALAGMVPMVFLGVAAFLLNMVLGRLIRLQRSDIATLKAIGYTNREVGFHYLWLVVIVVAPGLLLGTLGGWLLGREVLRLYAAAFRFPTLSFLLSPSVVSVALLASALAALIGAYFAVRSAVRLPPAEAMRPPAPPRYKRSLIERLGLGLLAGPSGMMVLRELGRRPLRTLLSAVGISGAVALILLGRFGWDSLNRFLERTYLSEQRQDLTVSFTRPLEPRALGELSRLPGVLAAEALRVVPVRVRYEHRQRDCALLGMPPRSELRKLVERSGGQVQLPTNGVLMSKTLALILGVAVGEQVEIQIREGEWRQVRPTIVGFVDESLGLYLYAESDVVAALEQDQGAISTVLLSVEPGRMQDIERRLKRSPSVVDIAEIRGDIERLRDMNASIIDVWTAVAVALAASVIFGVVYNNARIALAARSRELASLRVLGFTRTEISSILLGGLAFEVLLAIPLGLYLGWRWAKLFMLSVDQETFRWSVAIEPRTYFLASAVALLAGAASALMVRRSLDRLDLIGVLKTRE